MDFKKIFNVVQGIITGFLGLFEAIILVGGMIAIPDDFIYNIQDIKDDAFLYLSLAGGLVICMMAIYRLIETKKINLLVVIGLHIVVIILSAILGYTMVKNRFTMRLAMIILFAIMACTYYVYDQYYKSK